jgi:hypothetical protein
LKIGPLRHSQPMATTGTIGSGPTRCALLPLPPAASSRRVSLRRERGQDPSHLLVRTEFLPRTAGRSRPAVACDASTEKIPSVSTSARSICGAQGDYLRSCVCAGATWTQSQRWTLRSKLRRPRTGVYSKAAGRESLELCASKHIKFASSCTSSHSRQSYGQNPSPRLVRLWAGGRYVDRTVRQVRARRMQPAILRRLHVRTQEPKLFGWGVGMGIGKPIDVPIQESRYEA